MNKTTHYPSDEKKIAIPVATSTNPVVPKTKTWAKWLALGIVAGPILFTHAWLILGFLSPGFTMFGTLISPYSPISQSISGLGLGPTAVYMNAAFILSGLLVMVGAIGTFQCFHELSVGTRKVSTTLFALSGLGMAMDGIFTLGSVLLHTIGFLMGTGIPVAGFLVLGKSFRRIPGLKRLGNWLLLASPLTLALLVLYFSTFDPIASMEGLGVAGLTQRILVIEVHVWLVALGWKAYRHPQPASAH